MERPARCLDVDAFPVLDPMSALATGFAIERWPHRRRVDVSAGPTFASLEPDLARGPAVVATIASNAPYIGLPGTGMRIVPALDERAPFERFVAPVDLPKTRGPNGAPVRTRSGG